MPFIPLSNSELQVEVSKEDHLYLLLFNWHLNNGYPRTGSNFLHRIVANRMNLSSKMDVDHIDRNKLNAKRENLRSATHTEQRLNACKPSHNTSGHKCIDFHVQSGKWRIRIKQVHIGLAESLEAAIQMRDAYLKRNNLTFVE